MLRFFPLLGILLPLVASAQLKFNVGYNAGYYLHPLADFEVLAFELNDVNHSYWTDRVKVHQFGFGPSVELGFGTSNEDKANYGIMLSWHKLQQKEKGGGINPVTGFDEIIEFKLRMRRLAVELYGGTNVLTAGVTLDIGGRFRLLYKRDYGPNNPPQEGPVTKWTDWYNPTDGFGGGFQMYGAGVYLQTSMLNNRVRPRLYCYFPYMNPEPGFSPEHYYRAAHLMLQLNMRVL